MTLGNQQPAAFSLHSWEERAICPMTETFPPKRADHSQGRFCLWEPGLPPLPHRPEDTSGFLAPGAVFPHPTSIRSPSSSGCSSRPCTPTQSRFLVAPEHVNGQAARGYHFAAKPACQQGSRRPHFFPGPLTLCCPRISGILPRHLHSSEGVYNITKPRSNLHQSLPRSRTPECQTWSLLPTLAG